VLGRDVANHPMPRLRLKLGAWDYGVRFWFLADQAAVSLADRDSCCWSEHDPGRSGAGRIARKPGQEICFATRNRCSWRWIFPTATASWDGRSIRKKEFRTAAAGGGSDGPHPATALGSGVRTTTGWRWL